MSNWVQVNSTFSAGTDTTIATTLSGVVAGSLVAVCVSCLSGVTISVADDLAVASQVGPQKTGISRQIEIHYFKNYGGGSRTFTATFSAGTSTRSIVAIEYAGRDTVAPYDQGASANGNDDVPTVGPLTPAQNGSLFLGYMGALSLPEVVSPFELVFENTTDFFVSEDFIQTAAASQAATWSLPAPDFWAGVLAVFKPASPPPGPKISGTAPGKTEGELRDADKTIVITLTGGPVWIA